jgi:hypothetical protein
LFVEQAFSNKQAKTGVVTIIQRFGSALNLNIHFHMLLLEGAISENSWGGNTFTRIKAASDYRIWTPPVLQPLFNYY